MSSFTQWLEREVTTASCALLKLYEEFDRLRHIEGPQLEGEYMEKVGKFEETVIAEEIECEVLKKKQQMIQTAINRREPVDETAIDAELGGYREKLMKEASGEEDTVSGSSGEGPMLDELQELYRQIVQNFHPQMHPELTEAQKLLFQKAQEAYRRKDKEAMQLIYNMLQSSNEADSGFTVSMLTSVQISLEQSDRMAEDYSLAAKLYRHFQPAAEEAAMQEDLKRHRRSTEEIMAQMEHLREQFPYNAAQMLSDPEELNAYLGDLQLRLQNAKKERQQRTSEIQKMLERVRTHE